MPCKIIACEVMKEELADIRPEGQVDFEFIAMGLHDFPDKLHSELQSAVNRSIGYETVILAFGLCGNAVKGLKAEHCPLIIPKIHECIPMLLGNVKTYNDIKTANPGTYFLSGGWTEGERTILSEFDRFCRKFGREEAVDIFNTMYGCYNSLIFINTSHPRKTQSQVKAKKTADLLSLHYEELNNSSGFMERLINGPWNQAEFITVSKGGTVEEKGFY